MKRSCTLLLLYIASFLSTDCVVAQIDTAYRRSISVSSGYFFASNAITNNLAGAYFKNEFIDDEMKDAVSGKLKSLNRLGIAFNTEIKYTETGKRFLGLDNSFYSVSIGNNYHINSDFSKDAFEIYFRGNSDYRGKTADLSDFVYNQVIYQNVRLTFGHSFKRANNQFGFSAGISLNKGQKLYELKAERALITTEEMGRYIDLDASIEIHQSDSSEKKLISWNGTGSSIDFSFYREDKNRNRLQFTATNFGFINWNKNTAFIDADTSFRFEGIDVSDLFDFNDSISEGISLDSSLVEPYLTTRIKKSYLTPLPARLRISYLYNFNEQFSAEAGLENLFFAGSKPAEFLTLNYSIKKTHKISILASYGGYTKFQAGLSYNANINDKIILTLRSDYLSDMLNSKKGIAQGAFVSFTVYL